MSREAVDIQPEVGELTRELIRRQLLQMLCREDGTEYWSEGPFQSGWQSAIEDVAYRLDIDMTARAKADSAAS